MITTATNTEYDNNEAGWSMTRRMTSARLAQVELIQGAYESDSRFQARRKLTDFHPLTTSTLQRIVGMLYARQADIVREAPVDLESVGAGGEGIDVVSTEIALNLLIYNAAVVVVEQEGVTVTSPLSCPRWDPAGTYYTITSSRTESTTDPATDEEVEQVWTVYRPSRFEIYRKIESKTNKEPRDQLITQEPWREDDVESEFRLRREPHAPVLRPTMPWPTALGAAVAKAHRAIYRAESRADAAELEAVASTKIQAAVMGDQDAAQAFAKALKSNESYVPYSDELGQHLPLSLPTGPAEQLRETIEAKERRLYKVLGITAAANAQRSATEAMLDISTGIATSISTLADKMQDVERNMLSLLAQARDTTTLGRAQDVTIDYPNDFAQVDLTTGEES